MASESISPTAHYTGHVWVRHGLSHPELATAEGRLLFHSLEPVMLPSRALGGPTLEKLLVARHLKIDELLAKAIEDGSVSQVVEIACGMSPRGWRFRERYGGDITYIEADLPGMVERKLRALQRMGSLGEHHRVVELDALREGGPGSLDELAATLDSGSGLALVTEGLLTYVDHASVLAMWRRFARVGGGFASSLYLSDLSLSARTDTATAKVFYLLLSAFVRGRVHTHFDHEHEAVKALRGAGFAHAALHAADIIYVVEAGSA